ncbi:MAG: hypothetical protein QOI47_1001 [Actinomycetota bacterium]|nr:hypothetical protein [Actinomycetota bacterium]
MDDPRSEASARLAGRYDARVLEPSPPPDDTPPFLADDPVHRPGVAAGPVVAPVPGFEHTWDDLCRGDDALGAWCAERWLGAWRRLPDALPADLVAERTRLHAVAVDMSEARKAVNGKIGLRYVRGGFGTPFFGDGQQRRADAGFLGVWFGFCASALDAARLVWSAFDTRVQIWPEHFDASIDAGERRATYGGSPGDDDHPEPYLYVSPWEGHDDDPFWNDGHFASLPYAVLADAGDQRDAALSFFRAGRHRLG